jgi:hypothetical protein
MSLSQSVEENFRNEVVKANQENQRLYSQIVSEEILPATVTPLNIPLNTLESGESQ